MSDCSPQRLDYDATCPCLPEDRYDLLLMGTCAGILRDWIDAYGLEKARQMAFTVEWSVPLVRTYLRTAFGK